MINKFRIIILLIFPSFLLSDECNDPSAINYNNDDDSACAYFDIDNNLEVSEDENIEINLLGFASGSYLDSGFSFNVNCDNASDVSNCSINNNYTFTATIEDKNSDYHTGNIILTVTYIDFPNFTEYFKLKVDAINDPLDIQVSGDLEAIQDRLFEYRIDVNDVDDTEFTFTLLENPASDNDANDFSLISYSSFALVSYTPKVEDNVECNGECFKFKIGVTDSGDDPTYDEQEFTVQLVESTNDLPIISLTNADDGFMPNDESSIAYQVDEDETNFRIKFNITDENGDNYQNLNPSDISVVSIYSRNNQLPHTIDHGQVQGSNPNFDIRCDFYSNWNGDFDVSIIIDNDFSYTTYFFKVNAASQNDHPYMWNYTGINFSEGSSISRTINYYDVDSSYPENELPYDYSTMIFSLENKGDGNILHEFLDGGSGNNSVLINFYTDEENSDWNGVEQFEATINDGQGSGDKTETFDVIVNNLNDSPTIDLEDFVLSMGEDQVEDFKVEITANDIDNNDLSFSYSADYAQINFLNESGKDYLYLVPNTHYYGPVNFTITVDDNQGYGPDDENDNETSVVSTNEYTVTVDAANDPPITKDIEFYVNEDSSNNEIELLGNNGLCENNVSASSNGTIICNCDSNSFTQGACDIESTNLTFTIMNAPNYASYYNILNNSTFVYTPNSNYNGSDLVQYQVCDNEEEQECSLGKINITVENINDTPEVFEGSATVDEDDEVIIQLSASDIDPGDDCLDYIISTPAANGSVLITPPTFDDEGMCDNPQAYATYIPNTNYNGDDSFTFYADDGEAEPPPPVTVSITIIPVNDAPILDFVQNVDFDEDNENDSSSSDITLLSASDIDDGDLIYYSIVNKSNEEIIQAILDGNNLSFKIEGDNNNFNGSENFTITVSDRQDNSGLIAEQDIIVTVNPTNDEPVLLPIDNVAFNEDEGPSNVIVLSADDVDDVDFYYNVEYSPQTDDSDSEFILPIIEDDNLSFSAEEHYYGSRDFIITVSDREDNSGLTDQQEITVTVNSINDRPQVKLIDIETKEDCATFDNPITIELLDNSICDNDDLDGILCDCSDPNYTEGSCDIDNDNLSYHIVQHPENGTASINESTGEIQYIPNTNYISPEDDPDLIYYQLCDQEACSITQCELGNNQNEDDCVNNILDDCNDGGKCGVIKITVNEVNDSPVLTCNDCNLSLSDNNYLENNQLYEDCYQDEKGSNDKCDDIEGISVNHLRINQDYAEDPCNSNHLWTDSDCEESPDNFGIAVDLEVLENDNINLGTWEYLDLSNGSFKSLLEEKNDECLFKLLDQDVKIRFRPESNYYSTNQEYPTIKYYAWDKSNSVDDTYCIVSLEDNNENDEDDNEDDCPPDGSPFSNSFITLSMPIISVNDSPVFEFVDEYTINEYCDDNVLCDEDGVDELTIHFSDNNDFEDQLYYYVSHITTSSNSSKKLFDNIHHYDEGSNLDEYNLLNDDYLSNDNIAILEPLAEGKMKLNLNYLQNVNGRAEITVKVSDRESIDDSEVKFATQTIGVIIEQVNNRIADFNIVPDIVNYSESDFNNTDFSDESINNQKMIHPFTPGPDDDLYIKFPPYIYNQENLDVSIINQDNYRDIYDNIFYDMDYMYFKWTRKDEDDKPLDIDLNPMINGDPYKLYYRLEFVNEVDDMVFVLKDSINDNLFSNEDYDYGYTKVKITDRNYKYYFDEIEEYDPETDSKKKIDVSGLTSYKWRIVASNYENIEIEDGYDIDTKATSLSNKSYGIKLNIPKIEYNFILNDIYTNYFNLYLTTKPTYYNSSENNYENVIFNDNQEIYLTYNDELETKEIFNVDNVSIGIGESNIFSTLGTFNKFGEMSIYIPIEDHVGTVNIQNITLQYNSIEPYSFDSINSESGNFNLELNSNEQYNVLLYEINKDDIGLLDSEDIIVSDMLVIDGNSSNFSGSIGLNYTIDSLPDDFYQDSDKITYAIYNNGYLENINTSLNGNVLKANLSSFGSYVLTYNPNNKHIEIPQSTSIISCYPNPFNPHTNIVYNLERSSDVLFAIYNIKGQEIYSNISQSMNEGENQFLWIGQDDYGRQVSSGVYLIKITAADAVLTQKVTLLK